MAGLEGLRVLDMSSGIAGPFCARLLADSGADVIRIARPAPAESGLTAGARVSARSQPSSIATSAAWCSIPARAATASASSAWSPART